MQQIIREYYSDMDLDLRIGKKMNLVLYHDRFVVFDVFHEIPVLGRCLDNF